MTLLKFRNQLLLLLYLGLHIVEALCLIDSFVSASEPPCEFETVVIVTLENPPMLPDKLNELALFETVLFVTMYSNITMLPSSKQYRLHHRQSKLHIYHLVSLYKINF